MAKILVVDDEEKIREILKIMLESTGHQALLAKNGRYAIEILQNEAVDMVISDIQMDEIDGLKLLSLIRKNNLGCPVVFITAYGTLESAVKALRLGAVDYLVKPFDEKSVTLAVERALGIRTILAENARLRMESASRQVAAVFSSPAMQKVRQMAAQVAVSEATVLLTGESGTGKEVVARLIHQTRKKGRFVALNCAAIAPTLLESELFGHVKGSFTGADKAHTGKFEFVGEGTLFLDEIGELSLDAQAKLLRALQEKTIQKIGSNQDVPVKCRLICATNRDLNEHVHGGKFREDLFYRLAVFPIHIPPLRERREDIVPLLQHSLRLQQVPIQGDILTPAARQLLLNYHWPGNVRELFNAVERAVIIKGGKIPFNSDDFSYLGQHSKPGRQLDQQFKIPIEGLDYDALQRKIVRQALAATAGNQSSAARLLGVTRARFRTLLGLLDNGSDSASKGEYPV